jgi:putative ABC transport system permease protein
MIYAMILQTMVIPIECLKLMTALIVALSISAPYISSSVKLKNRARRETGHA